jgi:hypothetical protein
MKLSGWTMTHASTAWHEMSEEEKGKWRQAARKPLSGYNIFVKETSKVLQQQQKWRGSWFLIVAEEWKKLDSSAKVAWMDRAKESLPADW